VALYRGAEDSLTAMYPSDFKLNVRSAGALSQARAAAVEAAREAGVSIIRLKTFESREEAMILADGELRHLTDDFAPSPQSAADMAMVGVLTESMFNALQDAPISLKENEIAWYSRDIRLPAAIVFGGQTYAARELTVLDFRPSFTSGVSIGNLYLVVKDGASFGAAEAAFILQADLEGAPEEKEAFAAAFKTRFQDYHNLFVRDSMRAEMYALYGGILFVGIFLGTLFLMATALIIYFKQISEGYQDQDRFVILQKVGMSAGEVRKTVSRQILTVFFLPLLTAICHVAGSLRMIALLLRILRISNVPYIAVNVFLAAAFVALLYGVFYAKTAKTYSKMVRF
jgi:putative ABC transport system permease protein